MKNLEQRIHYIRQQNEAAKKDTLRPTYPIKEWREKKTPLYLKIIQLDVDYLMFRLENSRTEIQQLRYLRANPALPPNLFENPESSIAQEAQEAILNIINKEAGREFVEDLKTRGQDEPAIITYDGYLINGNRRTAALKGIGQLYIDCVVLPEDTTPKDIYELEQSLQIAEDFKEPYHWINELRNIKRGLEDKRYDYTELQIAKRLRIDIKELRSKRKMLDLLDAFLIWRQIPGQYDYPKLEDTEQIFIQLEKALKKYQENPKKFEELRNAIFTLIEEKPSKGRLYGYVMDLIKNFEAIYAKIKREELDQNETKNDNLIQQQSLGKSIIDSILEGQPIPNSTFSDYSKAQILATDLVEAIADIKAANKEKNNNEAVYESVSIALRELMGLTIDTDTAKLINIKQKLRQIIDTSEMLLNQIENFEN